MSNPVALLNRYWRLSASEREKEYETTKYTANLLRMTESRVRQLVDEGRMPAIKIYGRILIHLPTLKAMIESAQE